MHYNLFGIYDANFDLQVVWIFWIELSGSVLTLILLGKELKGFANPFDKATCKRMLSYTWPLLVMGLAGQLNQCASQIIFPYVFNGTAEEARVQLGIYSLHQDSDDHGDDHAGFPLCLRAVRLRTVEREEQ